MTRAVRAALFWSFLLAFLLLAPLLVLYTFGFRYNLQTGELERTGIISVSTFPRGASVTLDGNPRRETTPALLKQLRPRAHQIHLTSDGYHAWEKTVVAREQETVFLESVVLWADQEPELASTRGEKQFVDPTGTAVASLEQGGAWTEVWVETYADARPTLVARFPGSELENIGVQWSPDGAFLLLAKQHEMPFVVSRDGLQKEEFDTRLPGNLMEIWWDEGRAHTLVAVTPSRTMRLELAESKATDLLSRPTEALLSNDTELLFTVPSGEGTLVMAQSPREKEEAVALLPIGTYRFISSQWPFVLLFEPVRGRIVLVDADNHDQPILLNTEADAAYWNQSGEQLLYTNGFETHVFSPRTLDDVLIDRLSQPITAIAWHPAGTAALLARQDGIVAYDLHEPGFVQTKLNNAQDVSRVWIDDKGEVLHFLGTVDGVYGRYQQAIR